MNDLAERCEAAAGPDRELDAEIAVTALGFFVCEPRYEGAPVAYGYVDEDGSPVEPGHGGDQLIQPFTASLDAAMTLVPDGWVLAQLALNDKRDNWGALVWVHDPWTDLRPNAPTGDASTPALALCAAALRARSGGQS